LGSLRSHKGISEIIATLLIIMMTVTAGTLFAAYASGVLGRIMNPSTAQPYTEQFSVEDYTWNTLSTLQVNVRNTGLATTNLSTADYYLSGTKIATPTFSCTSPATSTAVVPSSACQLTWSLTAGSYTSGIAYVLKIVLTNDGSTFTFSLIAGSNTH